ncbi:MAG: hypothetical protein JXB25_09060, partial [Deltaproteobacteria bacterium]|nr:hypothetical protein [Deltaproteobacteria bacterium]
SQKVNGFPQTPLGFDQVLICFGLSPRSPRFRVRKGFGFHRPFAALTQGHEGRKGTTLFFIPLCFAVKDHADGE